MFLHKRFQWSCSWILSGIGPMSSASIISSLIVRYLIGSSSSPVVGIQVKLPVTCKARKYFHKNNSASLNFIWYGLYKRNDISTVLKCNLRWFSIYQNHKLAFLGMASYHQNHTPCLPLMWMIFGLCAVTYMVGWHHYLLVTE